MPWTPSSRASPAPAVPQPRREQHPLGAARQGRHNHVLHERVVILAIETLPVPYVRESERININRLSYPDDGITHVGVRFGYTDEPDVPAALALALAAGLETEVHTDDVSNFLSTIELRAGHTPEMSRWRKRLFLAAASITADTVDYFNLLRPHRHHRLPHHHLTIDLPTHRPCMTACPSPALTGNVPSSSPIGRPVDT